MSLSILQKRTREFYENQADEFNRTRQYVWPGTKKFLDKIDVSAKVLEIGCGNGRNMGYRKELNIKGIDYSKKLVDLVNEKFNDNQKAVQANMIDLPFEDNSFDLVISINTLHNLDRNGFIKGLKEVMRVSKKHSFITVDAYRNEEEKEAMFAWNLTAKTIMSVDEWEQLYDEEGYGGDYYWFIP